MITLTKEELNHFVPVANQVLVRPNRGESEYVLPGGVKIQIDISYNQEQHAPVTGTVISAPKSIFAARKNFPGMWWDVDMELQKGDVVAYSYHAAVTALEKEEGRIIMCEGFPHFIIPYEECFVAKRFSGGAIPGVANPNVIDPKTATVEIIPINGYCLVEPVEEVAQFKIGSMVLQSVPASEKSSPLFGRVAYVSKGLIRNYIDGDGKPDIDEVRPGDYIAFDRACDLLCEYDLHASLEGKKKFYRIQRRYIQAVVPKDIVDAHQSTPATRR